MLPKFQQPSNKASKALVVSGVNSALSSHHGTLKEESSDDSTIISSQASTLTRAPNEVMTFEVEDLDPEVVIPSEPLMHLMSIGINIFKKLHSREFSSENLQIFFTFSTDKETNTECVFIKMTSGARPKVKMNEAINVKRSKTLGPKDVSEEKQLVEVKLNRSDSDGSMPLYKKLPFQHKIKERRSLRLPTKFNPKP